MRIRLAVLTAALLPAVAFAGNPTYVSQWGTHGIGQSQFDRPIAVASNFSFEIFVLEQGNSRVQVFTQAGAFIRGWGGPGPGIGRLDQPTGMTTDGDNLYVAEAGGNRIQEFNEMGVSLRRFGGPGTGPGKFNYISDVAYAKGCGNCLLYAADYNNHRVQAFTLDGAFVAQWPLSFRPWRLTAILGMLWVTDQSGGQVAELAADGSVVRTIGAAGSGNGEFGVPEGMAFGALGYLAVADPGNHRVQFFSGTGSYLGQWGSQGTGPGQFLAPIDIAFGGSGRAYVADADADRISIFQFDMSTAAAPTTWGRVKSLYRR